METFEERGSKKEMGREGGERERKRERERSGCV